MFVICGGTDAGLVRKTNQDRYAYGALSEPLAYAVVCDGMGGQKGGSVAAEEATKHLADVLARDLRPDMGEASLKNVMMTAVAGANALVYQMAAENPELAGMGTTLIASVFTPEHLFVAYVGDSRAYHLSADGHLSQLTKDHTVVQMLLDLGEISEEEAKIHPKRHYITRAVGVGSTVDADFLEHPLQPEDVVLLCSDGLYQYLEGEPLEQLLRESIAQGSVDNLIQLAREGGGGDNITAVVACRQPEVSPQNDQQPHQPETLAGKEN